MRDEVRRFIEEGVPAGLADKVAALVRPCVACRTVRRDETAIPVGQSKFGGRPDVPRGFSWPARRGEPCWFIAQFRFADLAPFETGFRLPRSGLLSFFYHDHQGTAGRGSRVYAFPDKSLVRRDVVPDERYGGQDFHDRHLYSRSFQFSQGYCLPAEPSQYGLTARERARWPWEELLNFKELFHARWCQGAHLLFGQPAHSKPPRGYTLLASFGEVEDRYLFFAAGPRVADFDFERLRVVYECT